MCFFLFFSSFRLCLPCNVHGMYSWGDCFSFSFSLFLSLSLSLSLFPSPQVDALGLVRELLGVHHRPTDADGEGSLSLPGQELQLLFRTIVICVRALEVQLVAESEWQIADQLAVLTSVLDMPEVG